METLRGSGGAITHATFVPDSVLGVIIPHPETRGADAVAGEEELVAIAEEGRGI